MDSNQPATKDPNVIIFQNQDVDNVSNSSEEDGGIPKRFKGEQLDPLKIGSVNFQQNQEDDNVQSLMETDGASMESSQPELDPLQIGSILEKVFSNLDVDSIKNARQVNPLWSIEGAKMLITKCYLEIPRNLQKQESSNSKEMDEFKTFLSYKSSDRSMITNITIDKAGDVEWWKSLGVLGQQIESLKLNIIDDEAEMLKNLLDLLPNLNYLCMKNVHCGYWATSGFHIIQALNSVMSSTEKDKSPLVISNVTLRSPNMEELEAIEKFADCSNILIEELNCFVETNYFDGVPNLGIRISNFMNKLLSTSQNILKSLTIRDCTFLLHRLEFPCMPALTCLGLIFQFRPHDPLQPLKFSPSFRFSEKVPNLIHVKFILHDLLPPPFVHLFEQTGTAPSVKIVEVNQGANDFDIAPLLQNFPNIEEYEVRGSWSREMFESIWNYGANLRKLTINIDNNRVRGDIAGLDSFITGFTQETVEKIKETPNLAPYPLEEMEQLRVNPSILKLKHLGHLEIHFVGFDQNDMPARYLATAGEYAFKLMPKDSKILMDITCGSRRRGGAWYSALNEVSKLANVTIKFDECD